MARPDDATSFQTSHSQCFAVWLILTELLWISFSFIRCFACWSDVSVLCLSCDNLSKKSQASVCNVIITSLIVATVISSSNLFFTNTPALLSQLSGHFNYLFLLLRLSISTLLQLHEWGFFFSFKSYLKIIHWAPSFQSPPSKSPPCESGIKLWLSIASDI